eukprot:snap_masked-scaffold634_size121673-processed-gene-0.13 protein:Tk06608 transcript:snap_masked-scaffold634_size121673-processed-gene-0.13-mRNA-1 annotation:"sodium calcium exchanger 2-like"
MDPDTVEPFYGSWTENKTQICYEGEGGDSWCGYKDKCSTLGLILPIVAEESWPSALRGILYLIGLLYSFLGVSIVADIFMCAIEKITSKTKKIHIATPKGDTPEYIEVPVWNGTVANLTLMALGSSAPEILLNVIEIIGNNFEAGELGPGTIVGSAAFNLLAISAVCVIGIPTGETRRIEQVIVFGVTATFSVMAYIWLLVILKWVSPNEVELWEAILTFVFFPVLVVVAYCADKQWLHVLFCQPRTSNNDKERQIELGNFTPAEEMLKDKTYFRNGQLDRDGLVSFIKDVKKNTKLSDEDAAIIAASKYTIHGPSWAGTRIVDSKPHSRMWYRIGAVRNMTGGRKTQPSERLNEKLKENQRLLGLILELLPDSEDRLVWDNLAKGNLQN